MNAIDLIGVSIEIGLIASFIFLTIASFLSFLVRRKSLRWKLWCDLIPFALLFVLSVAIGLSVRIVDASAAGGQ